VLEYSCYQNTYKQSLDYSEILLGNKGRHSVSNKMNNTKIGQILYKL